MGYPGCQAARLLVLVGLPWMVDALDPPSLCSRRICVRKEACGAAAGQRVVGRVSWAPCVLGSRRGHADCRRGSRAWRAEAGRGHVPRERK